MLGRSRKKRTAKIDTLIGENTEIVGEVRFSGGLHVDGAVRGNVYAKGESNSIFSLSEQGVIEGEINVPYNMIDGAVKGNIYSSEHVELGPKSHIDGDVYYNLLEISSGAQVSGRLVHAPDRAAEQPDATGEVPEAPMSLMDNDYN